MFPDSHVEGTAQEVDMADGCGADDQERQIIGGFSKLGHQRAHFDATVPPLRGVAVRQKAHLAGAETVPARVPDGCVDSI